MAKDPYRYFRVEARELCGELGQGALDLEKGADPERLARLLRAAHTLKGAARVVRQVEIAELTHSIEDLLAPHRDGGEVPRQTIDRVFVLVDAIEGKLGALSPATEPGAPDGLASSVQAAPAAVSPAGASPKAPPPAPSAAPWKIEAGPLVPPPPVEVTRPAPEPTYAGSDEPLRTVSADLAEMDALVDGVAQAYVPMKAIRRGLDTAQRAADMSGLIVQQLTRARDADQAALGARAIGFAEELRGICDGLVRNMTQAVEQMERELSQVHDTAEQLRLVPAATLFTTLERTARDAARAVGKQVVFSGRGGDVRLDAHVLSAIRPALVQAIRNAIAHGIEAPADRVVLGKRPEGRVAVEVVRQGRRVFVRVHDDGRGVDLGAVKRAVMASGVAGDDLDGMSKEQILALLLRARISTSTSVTQVSGRGVGLDVVRDAAARLGGTVTLRSPPGEGTTLELAVPLVMAAVEALLVEAAGLAASFPLEAVRASIRLTSDDITGGPRGMSILHEGQVMPFIPLQHALGRPGAGLARAYSVVVVEARAGRAAFGVDRLLGTANVVVRPLPELALVKPVVAGASVDAAGTPELMLDPDELIAFAQGVLAVDVPAEVPRLPLLVIDDSLTTRMLEQSILESAGYEVDLATSAEEGMEMARKRRYGVFVVDVEMPGMDGFEFVARTRKDPELGRVPAILVTSRNAPEDLRRGDEAGAHGYIVKGEFDQRRLLELIQSAGVH